MLLEVVRDSQMELLKDGSVDDAVEMDAEVDDAVEVDDAEVDDAETNLLMT